MKRILILLVCSLGHLAYAGPSVFPTGVTVNSNKAFDGLTLFNFSQDQKVYLIDMDGNVVNEWSCADCSRFDPLVKPLPNGRILAICGLGGSKGLCEYRWDGSRSWQFHRQDWGLHHDFFRFGNGNTLVLAKVDLFDFNIAPYEIRDNQIYEITDTGQVLWSWKASEHFDELGLSQAGRDVIYNGEQPWGDLSDIFHTNTIQPLPNNKHADNDARFQPGNILVSQRSTGQVFIVDRATGDIVWRLDDVIDSGHLTIGQHHSSMIPKGVPGAGNILIFDNGGHSRYPVEYRFYSRVVEVNPINGKVVWEYHSGKNSQRKTAFFSKNRGSAQRLPNGNTLITEALSLRIFEVTSAGEIVWEYVHPATSPANFTPKKEVIYRAYRVAPGWGTTNSLPDPSGRRRFVW